ncbi:LysR family transcriptional regulator [Sphingosinicella sp. BN140058]|uniref:LysR family transcriptional regulator n=1 Tax=Sphingosinicella sp. BN140058 TaxID=1892855 RepID=UPI001012745B|nr:LysR family transcriptional regulator [Sphingosinicella sp. BN140058]QAY77991.1 LysR family transcriptional regulator [Sphingosinicella sp. BN140058]
MLDWNDLRYFLAVADSGSTLAAGRTLRVSQTTAARRVIALEEAIGTTLFERRQAGYTLTAAGEALIAHARAVEAAATGFADAAAAQAREVSGIVRLTTEEIFAVTVLAPILRDLHEAHPQIRIELETSEEVRDLAAGAADVALRSADSLSGTGLVGRRVATGMWAIYCSRAYAEANGRPRSRRALRRHPLIGGGGRNVWQHYGEWLKQNELEDAVAIHHGSATGLLSAVRSGFGLAALPCFVADFDPDLICCLPPGQDGRKGLWLLTHERLRHVPSVRIVLDFLADRLSRLAREGEQRRVSAFEEPHRPVAANGKDSESVRL